MGTIKENYQIMFTSYPDLVNVNSIKRNAWNWYYSCLQISKK